MKKLSKINESVWSDIRSRANEKSIKKEDDINLLDIGGLYDLLKNKYIIDGSEVSLSNDCITIPVFKEKIHYSFLDIKYEDELNIKFFSCSDAMKYIIDKLYKQFDVTFIPAPGGSFVKSYYIKPKNNQKTTNTFVLDVIDFILENIPKEFECTHKKITESIWSDMRSRANGKSIKKENKIGNIKELNPIDLGGSILWADKDLTIYDEIYFTYDEANDLLKNQEWRLPTVKEVAELDLLEFNQDENSFTLKDKKTGNFISFNKLGFIYKILKEKIDEDYYYGWTSEPYELSSIHIFTIDDKELWHSPVYSKKVTDQVVQGKDDKLCVRLVKDK